MTGCGPKFQTRAPGCARRSRWDNRRNRKTQIAGIASEGQRTEFQSTEAQSTQSPNRRGRTQKRENTTPLPNEIRRDGNGTSEGRSGGTHNERRSAR